MTGFYDELAADALSLLTELGQPVTVTVISGAQTYDPATSTMVNATTDYPAVGAIFDLNDHEINGTLVQVGDKRIYVSAVGVPDVTLNDTVTVAGVTFRVINPNTIGPAGIPVLYDLHVRK